MKRTTIFIFLTIMMNFNAYSHNSATHQYIVIEALKLLEKQFNKNFSELDNYIGYLGIDEYCNDTDWHNKGTLASGAYLEDIWDPVYNFNIKLLGENKNWMTTLSHFWDPDYRRLYDKLIAPPCSGNMTWLFKEVAKNNWPTALDKMIKYINGHWYVKKYLGLNAYNFYDYEPTGGLIDYYFTGNIYKKCHNYYNPFSPYGFSKVDDNYTVSDDEIARKKLVYNIIGRMCHLLSDMSVPAHVHDTFHGLSAYDYYEDWMGQSENRNYFYAKKVLEEYGGFIDPYSYKQNGFNSPIEYLMYCMAQISQHYASRAINGNDIYNENIGEIKSVIDKFGGVGPTSTDGISYNHNNDDLAGIRDATFPYLIRATAGLFYWFLINGKQMVTSEQGDEGTFCVQMQELNLWKKVDLEGNHYTFNSSENIIVCPTGHEQEPDNGPFVIHNTAKNVTFRTNGSIIFKSGFQAMAGSDVHAYIGTCTACPDEDKNPKY